MSIISKIKSKTISFLSNPSWYDAYWGGATKFWHITNFNIDVVNLGSNSGKYAFDYEDLDLSGQNWALGPQSLQHDFNILKNYFSYLRSGATVIIPLSPFSCLHTKYGSQHNLKYYTFLHPATIMNFDESERVKALTRKYNPFKAMPCLCLRQMLLAGVKYIIAKMQLRRILHKRKSDIDYESNAVYFIDLWEKQFDIKDLDAPLSIKHVDEFTQRADVLSEMIDFCKERNLNPVLVIPPVHPSLANKLSEKCRQHYIYDFVKRANSANAPFYDFMEDTRFYNNEYFNNSYFLSKTGATKFTRIFLEEIGLLHK